MLYSNKIYAECLFKRGLKYADKAGDILHGRSQKLIIEWCKEHAMFPGSNREKRILNITINLNEILKFLAREYFEYHEIKKKEKRELDHSFILLSCPKMRCNNEGLAVLFKDYIPGDMKCKNCGVAMTTEEETQIEYELARMGIYSEERYGR